MKHLLFIPLLLASINIWGQEEDDTPPDYTCDIVISPDSFRISQFQVGYYVGNKLEYIGSPSGNHPYMSSMPVADGKFVFSNDPPYSFPQYPQYFVTTIGLPPDADINVSKSTIKKITWEWTDRKLIASNVKLGGVYKDSVYTEYCRERDIQFHYSSVKYCNILLSPIRYDSFKKEIYISTLRVKFWYDKQPLDPDAWKAMLLRTPTLYNYDDLYEKYFSLSYDEQREYSYDVIFSPDSFDIGPYYIDNGRDYNRFTKGKSSIKYVGADTVRIENEKKIGTFQHNAEIQRNSSSLTTYGPYIPSMTFNILLPPDFYKMTNIEAEVIDRQLKADHFTFWGTKENDSIYSEAYRLEYTDPLDYGMNFGDLCGIQWIKLRLRPYYYDAQKKELYVSSIRFRIKYRKGDLHYNPNDSRLNDVIYFVKQSCLNRYEDLYNERTLSGMEFIGSNANDDKGRIISIQSQHLRCIVSPSVRNATMAITNLTGWRQLSLTINERDTASDIILQDLPSGIYVCQLITDGKIADVRKVRVK